MTRVVWGLRPAGSGKEGTVDDLVGEGGRGPAPDTVRREIFVGVGATPRPGAVMPGGPGATASAVLGMAVLRGLGRAIGGFAIGFIAGIMAMPLGILAMLLIGIPLTLPPMPLIAMPMPPMPSALELPPTLIPRPMGLVGLILDMGMMGMFVVIFAGMVDCIGIFAGMLAGILDMFADMLGIFMGMFMDMFIGMFPGMTLAIGFMFTFMFMFMFMFIGMAMFGSAGIFIPVDR